MSASGGGASEANVNAQPALTPNQQLAQQITTALAVKGFVGDDKQQSFCAKLAAGQMKAEDWRTLIAGALRSAKPGEGAKQ
jgi:hypothetical protein